MQKDCEYWIEIADPPQGNNSQIPTSYGQKAHVSTAVTLSILIQIAM
jgi:hypothetical protein